jgi:4'-phosphopantetheinyl transferase
LAEIFVLDTQNVDESTFQLMLSRVSVKRREKAMRYRARKNTVLSLCAEMLIQYGYKKYFSTNTPLSFIENAYGKLYACEADDFYFNISHSGHYAVCAVAREEVGVDIEEIRQNFKIEISHFFHPKEYQTLMQTEAEQQIPLFYRYWTAKESYTKYRGMGLSLGLSTFYFDQGKIYTEEVPSGIITFYDLIPHYQIALCTSLSEPQNQLSCVSVAELF